jgi:hypothetical protein
MKMMVQAELRQGTTRRVCWIPDLPGIRQGSQVTLKGDAGWWTVKGLYARLPAEELHTDWKVGGL